MTTLKNIVEALNALDEIIDMTAKVGPWTVKIWDYNGEREVKFTRDVQKPTEVEMKKVREEAGDD